MLASASPASIDAIIKRMENLLETIDHAQGRRVKLRKAEMDLNPQMGKIRDAMNNILRFSTRTGRSTVDNLFGGDCMRIARIRQCLQSARFSTAMGGNETMGGNEMKATALEACQAVENVLIEMGQGSQLRAAQENIVQEVANKEEMQMAKATDDAVYATLNDLGIHPTMSMTGVLHLGELKSNKTVRSDSSSPSTSYGRKSYVSWSDQVECLDRKVELFVSEMKSLVSMLEEWPKKIEEDAANIRGLSV